MLSIPLTLTLTLILSFPGAEAGNSRTPTVVTHHFKHLDMDVTETRTLDPATGLIVRRAWDQSGRIVDLDSLRMAEQELKIAARGKISPELGEKIAAAADSDFLQVAFWLKCGDEPDFRGIMNAAVADGIAGEEARRMARDEGERFFSPKTADFADLLKRRGIEVDYIGPCWPIVIASVPAGGIREIAAMDRVDQAYYSFPAWESENNYAQPTLRSPTAHRRGNTGGSAVKVMVQDSGGHVVQNNPYLPPVVWLNSGYVDYHATAVAGNVCMNGHSYLYGAAPSLNEIYSAPGWGDVDAPAAWNLGIAAGVSFGNCSWWNFNKGSIVFLDRFFDYIIRNYGVLMFKSCGNQGSTGTPYCTSPGNGYNMLSTGCYNDGNTYKWDDDAMAYYTSWWNPVEGHEKPEVASPGDGVDTTSTSSPWIYSGFNGTSSASPLTMGTATLVANRDPSIIPYSEAVKAVIMVSAWHNVEGDALLSDKDGAGGVHAGAADAVARDGQYTTGTFTTSSFPGGYYDYSIPCIRGDGTRVICLWFSDPDAAYSTDILKMDLDMTILDPGGALVTTSSSAYNPFEIVYFEPAVTGTYTVRMTKQTFLGTSEPYCIAWSTRQDAAGGEITITGTGQIGTPITFDFYDQYEYNEDFVALASFGTLPNLINVGDGYILPVKWDSLTQACYNGTHPGFTGTLNGSGQASTGGTIPNNPSLIGTNVYLTMVILDGSSAPRDTAALAQYTIN